MAVAYPAREEAQTKMMPLSIQVTLDRLRVMIVKAHMRWVSMDIHQGKSIVKTVFAVGNRHISLVAGKKD